MNVTLRIQDDHDFTTHYYLFDSFLYDLGIEMDFIVYHFYVFIWFWLVTTELSLEVSEAAVEISDPELL